MIKEAIPIYYPEDPLIRAVQNAAKRYDGQYIIKNACDLFIKAIESLKIYDDFWLDDEDLLSQRAEYLFAPYMTAKKDKVVFATHPLFCRDIFENNEINSYLYNPVVFVTTPIAHYLLREYPIHVYIDKDKLVSANDDINLVQIGGLLMSEEDVGLPHEAILEIKIVTDKNMSEKASAENMVNMKEEAGMKTAAFPISRGVFKLDKHYREIMPDMAVWDKSKKSRGSIEQVEEGHNGMVYIKLENGAEVSIGKEAFDLRFIIV